MSLYGFSLTLTKHNGIDDVIDKVTAALQTEGFGVLTTIDVQAALKEKIGIDKGAYRILGACNPVLANEAIDADAEIGLLLPCNVLVRENKEGAMIVSFIDPEAAMGMVGNGDLMPMALEAKQRLQRAHDVLKAHS